MCGCGGITEFILRKYYDGVKLIEKLMLKVFRAREKIVEKLRLMNQLKYLRNITILR